MKQDNRYIYLTTYLVGFPDTKKAIESLHEVCALTNEEVMQNISLYKQFDLLDAKELTARSTSVSTWYKSKMTILTLLTEMMQDHKGVVLAEDLKVTPKVMQIIQLLSNPDLTEVYQNLKNQLEMDDEQIISIIKQYKELDSKHLHQLDNDWILKQKETIVEHLAQRLEEIESIKNHSNSKR